MNSRGRLKDGHFRQDMGPKTGMPGVAPRMNKFFAHFVAR